MSVVGRKSGSPENHRAGKKRLVEDQKRQATVQDDFGKWLGRINTKEEVSGIDAARILLDLAGAPGIGTEALSPLGLPGRLYLSKGDAFTAFSSEKERGIEEFARCLINGDDLPPPETVADYGVYAGFHGSSTVCVLFDRKRKIAVTDSVRNAQASAGSWDFFLERLGESLSYAKELERKGERFLLVVNGVPV